MRGLTGFFLLCVCTTGLCQESGPPAPVLSGYATRVVSGTDFDVNGFRVQCGAETQNGSPATGAVLGCPQKAPAVGQRVDVYGRLNRKQQTVSAQLIDIKPISREGISGFAVIDAVSGVDASAPGTREIRADGYRMRITPKTAVTFVAPLRSMADAMTNVWVEYDARPGRDGVYVMRSAKFLQNVISDREDTMRAKTDYDPAAVPADARPNPVAVSIGVPVNPKSIPPWPNAEMQEHLNAIGKKLIPAYQRGLAASDPSRIDFRFQLTNGKHWPWVLTLPSGIILVPHEVVERMENDSELAEVLADGIACALEKQDFRMHAAHVAITTGSIAGLAEFVPVVGGAAGLAGAGAWGGQRALVRKEEHQSGRVSLELMQDAGYDIAEAPKAWWLLASKKPKPVAEITMPDRAAYLYRVLAEEWSGGAP